MKRIPVNLASTPIEQTQWLRRVTLSAFVVVVFISAAQLLLAWSLGEVPATSAPETEALELLQRWSDEVGELAAADPRLARNVAISVELGNALIEQRVFPWGRLFTILEQSLPDDVRLEIIQPVTTIEGVRVSLSAASRSGDSLRAFLAALEARPEFLGVYPGSQSMGADGDLRLSVEALARIPDTDAGATERAGGMADQGASPREPGDGGSAQGPQS